jgi:hypothetical protein
MRPEKLPREIVYESRWVNLYLDKVKFPIGLVIEKFHLLVYKARNSTDAKRADNN